MTKKEILETLDLIALECEKQGEAESDKVAYFLSAIINFGLEVIRKAYYDKSFEIINKASTHILEILPELEPEHGKKCGSDQIVVNGPKDIQ